MMKRLIFSALVFLLACSASFAQGCGPTNPSCIVATAPVGTSNNQAASTAFVQNALPGSIPLTSGQILIGNSSNFAQARAMSNDCAITNTGIITCFGSSPLTVAKGGTGDTTFTANLPILGNGTGPLTQGTRSGNTTSFATTSGTLTSGDCAKFDASGNIADFGATCGSPLANPSGLIGMTAVNGVATTAGRSDGTHAIDPAIVPTWTGKHIWEGGVDIGSNSPSNVPAITVQNSVNSWTPITGSKPGDTIMRNTGTGNCDNSHYTTTPSIGPAPSSGLLWVCADMSDNGSGNFSAIFSNSYNNGSRYNAAITGTGISPTGTAAGNAWGGQFQAVGYGNANTVLQGLNIEADWGETATGSFFGAIYTLGSVTGNAVITPGNAFFATRTNHSSAGALLGWRLIADTTSPIHSSGSIIGIQGSFLSATNGINLTGGVFSGSAFKSTGFSVGPAGQISGLTYTVNGNGGASCSVGTLNPATAIVISGIITHC